jgi:Xaa-Pro aminopeptidase
MKQVSESRPVIPSAEYRQRWRKIQGMMGENRLDLLVAYADDRAAFGPAHARWLANIPVYFEPMCVLIPADGEPALLTGPESDEYARLIGHIPDVRVLREFTHPDEDYPYSKIQGLGEVAAEIIGVGQAIRRVGLAGRGLIGAEILAALRQALPAAEWIDIEAEICNLRSQKTPAEIEVIRHAYHIAEAGIQAAIDAIGVGVSEREVAAEAESAMRHAGAEGTGIDTIVASGPNSRPILARSTFRRIQSDELVLLTVAPRYEGYHGAIGRVVIMGNPGDAPSKALHVACKAQEACYKALKPGVEGRAVEALGRRIVEEAGFGRYFMYSGLHSVGVIEFEPPIFGPSSPAVLKEGMIISVDIPMFNAPWGGLRIEDGYLIAAAGAERLNETPYAIQK